MASQSAFAIFLLLVIAPIATLATTYIVGDESGWTVGFDYQGWAQGKNFQVGDKLVFWYPDGAHNVFRVNGTAFHNCIVPPLDQALTTGNDTILLATPGNKWYVCGVGKHCESGGQKLAINVQSYVPAPSPPASIPETPGPSPTMAPSPLSPAPYADSGSDAVDSEYFAPAPSPVEIAPWLYTIPAPSPVEFAPREYGTPAPPAAGTGPWYEAPAPAPTPAADTGYTYTETAAKKRPFINFFRE